ncbi:F-box/kelch-repeat protein At1g57790-like [Rutidosis leptorrhynchoides]|uniref:F-box/kelch-repeat protein At1g57790-like n=1 Tax=Rutidosis leptorrhynchoides TaxID=125765 RepID=UPI003A9952ED
MEHCVGAEYLNLRATCKLCCLATPLVHWSNQSSLRRLHNYSLNSSWMMVVDKHRGSVSFTDPLSGDNYFMKKNLQVLPLVDKYYYCSRYGWLLFKSREEEEEFAFVLFNPFTNDVRKLPEEFGYIESLCFSASPNSSNNCIVAGLAFGGWLYFIYSIVEAREPSSWRFALLDDDDDKYCKHSLTFIGQDLYALKKDGEVTVFKNLGEGDIRKTVLSKAPPPISSSCGSQYFLMNCDDEHLLLVIVGDEFGEVEVYKRNDDADKWEKIDSIGKHTIYIGDLYWWYDICLC